MIRTNRSDPKATICKQWFQYKSFSGVAGVHFFSHDYFLKRKLDGKTEVEITINRLLYRHGDFVKGEMV